MQLGKGRAKASLSICPGIRYQVPLPTPSILPLLLPSSEFANVIQGILQHSPQRSVARGEDPGALVHRAGPLMSTSILLQVGMGNADYLAAFLHVLLPLAFEVIV